MGNVKSTMRAEHSLIVMAMLLAAGRAAVALPIPQAVQAIGDRLVAEQITTGAIEGTWANQADYTGSIVAGLVNAYQITGKETYKSAAELGGAHVLMQRRDNPYGDEAFALALLTKITAENLYADTVKDFYAGIATSQYIQGFETAEPSAAVFYIAHHAVAAHMVGATDTQIWRDSLIGYLNKVDDDTAFFPVMSLGVATWALCQTGDMDQTRIDLASAGGADYWQNVRLVDLPGILLSHQVTNGDNAGSFYYRFDHGAQSPDLTSGYVEDAVFGTLGLIAADRIGWDFDSAIFAARNALAAGIGADGIVYEHISAGGAPYHLYAGETLSAIPEPTSLLLWSVGVMLLLWHRSRPHSLDRPEQAGP